MCADNGSKIHVVRDIDFVNQRLKKSCDIITFILKLHSLCSGREDLKPLNYWLHQSIDMGKGKEGTSRDVSVSEREWDV